MSRGTFATFRTWVNKARSRLAGRENVRARDEGAFPVTWYSGDDAPENKPLPDGGNDHA